MSPSSFGEQSAAGLGTTALERLHAVATAVHAESEVRGILEAASEISRGVLRHHLFVLALLDRRHGVLEARRVGTDRVERVATDSSGLGSVLAAGEARLLESPGSPLCPDCRSVAAAPLWLGGGRPGLLVVGSEEAGWFTEDDLRFLRGVAGHVSVAVERAHFRQREELRTRQLRLVSEVTKAVVSTLDPDLLLSRVVERVHERIGRAFTSIWRVDPGQSILTLTAVAGPVEVTPGLQVGANRGILGRCLETGEPVLIRDTRREQQYVGHPAYPGLSELVVPVRSRDAVVALINIEADQPDAFDEETATALSAVAGLCAAALENVHLYAEVRSFNETLKAQLAEATTELEQANQAIAAQKTLLEVENRSLKARLSEEREGLQIIGQERSLREALEMAERVGASEATCLIQGESGTGKELFAQLIHRVSPRSGKAYVTLNCAAIPENLLESTLFGHERGAYTGATRGARGLVESADQGTLFLDEIGEMSPALQSKVLRFLQSGEYYRVGGTELRRADVRVISATNRDLKRAVDQGAFRSDLFFRVAALVIDVPPLRMRPDDIALLTRHFLDATERGRAMRPTPELIETLEAYPWPGTVRELENVVARLVVLADGLELGPELLARELIEEASLPPASTRATREPSLVLTLEQMERAAVQRALARHQGDKKAAAADLGVALRTLYNKIQRFDIDVPRPRRESGPDGDRDLD